MKVKRVMPVRKRIKLPKLPKLPKPDPRKRLRHLDSAAPILPQLR